MSEVIDALASFLQIVIFFVCEEIGVHCGDDICCLRLGEGYKFPVS